MFHLGIFLFVVAIIAGIIALIAAAFAAIIAGTKMIRSGKRKKLGVFLRILGYVFILPITLGIIISIIVFKIMA